MGAILRGAPSHGIGLGGARCQAGGIEACRRGRVCRSCRVLIERDAANAIALAGHGGDSSAIRTALGRLDAGFIKLGVKGYRIAYARRRAENDGVRIILIIRNELEFAGRSSMKEFLTPPLAAVDVWLPSTGDGQANISCAATVVFRSADDIAITDWGDGMLRALDLRARIH